MRYKDPKCPKCGETLKGEADYVPGTAEVDEQSDGSFEYSGYTKMFWDGQVNERALEQTIKGEPTPKRTTRQPYIVRVICPNAHFWETERTNG